LVVPVSPKFQKRFVMVAGGGVGEGDNERGRAVGRCAGETGDGAMAPVPVRRLVELPPLLAKNEVVAGGDGGGRSEADDDIGRAESGNGVGATAEDGKWRSGGGSAGEGGASGVVTMKEVGQWCRWRWSGNWKLAGLTPSAGGVTALPEK